MCDIIQVEVSYVKTWICYNAFKFILFPDCNSAETVFRLCWHQTCCLWSTMERNSPSGSNCSWISVAKPSTSSEKTQTSSSTCSLWWGGSSFTFIQCFTCIFIHRTNLPKKTCKKDVLRTLQINPLEANKSVFLYGINEVLFWHKDF